MPFFEAEMMYLKAKPTNFHQTVKECYKPLFQVFLTNVLVLMARVCHPSGPYNLFVVAYLARATILCYGPLRRVGRLARFAC